MSAPGFRLTAINFDGDDKVESVSAVVSSSTLRLFIEFGADYGQFEPVSETEWKVDLTRERAIALIRHCGKQAPVNDGYEHTFAVWSSHLLWVVDGMDEEDW